MVGQDHIDMKQMDTCLFVKVSLIGCLLGCEGVVKRCEMDAHTEGTIVC